MHKDNAIDDKFKYKKIAITKHSNYRANLKKFIGNYENIY